MEDDPSTATRRKKDSSMSVALNLLRDGEGDACRKCRQHRRAAHGGHADGKARARRAPRLLAPVLPNGGRVLSCSTGGANVECTAEYLLQFAYMGSFYSHHILGCASPRVGLLNIGTEETKVRSCKSRLIPC
jgi:glycerol-3-phosphate acyltransferase PlsX